MQLMIVSDTASNLKDLFHNIYAEPAKWIIYFIHAIGLTNEL